VLFVIVLIFPNPVDHQRPATRCCKQRENWWAFCILKSHALTVRARCSNFVASSRPVVMGSISLEEVSVLEEEALGEVGL
jgi:hypothetical protein